MTGYLTGYLDIVSSQTYSDCFHLSVPHKLSLPFWVKQDSKIISTLTEWLQFMSHYEIKSLKNSMMTLTYFLLLTITVSDFAFVWRGYRLFNQNMNMNCLGLPKRTVCVFLWDTKNTKGFSNNSYYQNKVAQILVMQPFWSIWHN